MVAYPCNPSTHEAEHHKCEARLGYRNSKILSQVSMKLLSHKWNIYHAISTLRLRDRHRRVGGDTGSQRSGRNRVECCLLHVNTHSHVFPWGLANPFPAQGQASQLYSMAPEGLMSPQPWLRSNWQPLMVARGGGGESWQADHAPVDSSIPMCTWAAQTGFRGLLKKRKKRERIWNLGRK